MRYFMQYLKTENVNLIKDMGMIPYKLHQMFGYDSTVVTYKNGEYPYLDDEVKGLKIEFVDKKFNNYTMDGMNYLKKNASKIDILQVFHITLSTFVYVFTYKKYNPSGKIYLKLDSSFKLPARIDRLSKVGKMILKKMMSKIDFVSIEEERLYKPLLDRMSYLEGKFEVIPNGLDFEAVDNYGIIYDYSKKENIILTTARIGAEEKNIPMLLESFKNIKDIENTDWKLVLAGPVEEEFKNYLDDFINSNINIKDKIIVLGNIESRKELFELYNKSKIFSLTSDFESFGFSFIEAAAFGDVIVSTDVGVASELVEEENGILVKPGDIEGLTKAFEKYISMDTLEMESKKTYDICRSRYDWNVIVEKLFKNLKSIM